MLDALFAFVAAYLAWDARPIVRLAVGYGLLRLVFALLFPSAAEAGQAWYLVSAYGDAMVSVLALVIVSPASKPLARLAVLLIALDVAAYFEYPTSHTTIYDLYPMAVQSLEAMQVLVLLWFGATGQALLKRLKHAPAEKEPPWIRRLFAYS